MRAVKTCRSSSTNIVEEHRELCEVHTVAYATENSESPPWQDPSYNTWNEDNGSQSNFTENSNHFLTAFPFMKEIT
jgi:hypothetical protein